MNQKEHLDRIIDREVYSLANRVVTALHEHSDCWVDHVENFDDYKCPHCGEVIDAECLDTDEETGEYICNHCSERFFDPEQDAKEVYQWYAVSDWLAAALIEQGECVYSEHDMCFWGRTGCGYSLAFEPALWAIVKGLAS